MSTSPCERIEVGARDLLGGLDCGPAGEDCETGECLGFRRVEEAVAPVDRRAQGALAVGGVARAAPQGL